MERDALWMSWSWAEPVFRRRAVPLHVVPGYRDAVRATGTKGDRVVSTVVGWHEYFSVPPWQDPVLAAS
jgi:hypothetical protein